MTTYSVDIALSKGVHTFKIGSKDLNVIELGSIIEQQEIEPGSSQNLTERGQNMSIKVSQPATLTFKLDVSKPKEPLLTVIRSDFVE